MNVLNINNFKRILPLLAFIFLLIPVATSSLLDFEQKKADQLALEKERLQKEAEQKIYLMGRFDPAERKDFVAVPTAYSIAPYQMYLRKETLNAFIDMAGAAHKDKINLNIASATRNFEYQKNLWNNKWNGVTLVEGKDLSKSIPDGTMRFEKILEYSAAPGTSRHHFGTDIDINGATPEYFETEKGKKVYEWLTENAPLFGFCQTYNLKGNSRPTGYNEEKWHWSYLPLARDLTEQYKNLIKDADIAGFDGDEYVSSLDLINNYVLSINPDCL
ncbi:MAG: M15 family metallopeptidase [Patescibacteria group bacterium]